MASQPPATPLTTIPPTTSRAQQPRLSGAALSPTTLLLVACGTIGSILFTTTYLIEGATRPGYHTLQQSISALSLGPGGWVQQLNFIIFGLFTLCSAIGWRQALVPGAGALWYPLLKAISGIGLILDGIFSQDPAPGYPPGAALTSPTLHGTLHVIFAFVTITAIAGSAFVLARRFAVEPAWRWWAALAIIAGLLTLVFIALFGATVAHGGLAGLYERLATGVQSVLGLAVLVRLLIQAQYARKG